VCELSFATSACLPCSAAGSGLEKCFCLPPMGRERDKLSDFDVGSGHNSSFVKAQAVGPAEWMSE